MADWKDEVSGLDIAQVAERLGIKVKRGRGWPKDALCPFHDEATASLKLYGGRDPHFYCFGCHARGNTVELVKRRRNLDFLEALEWLRGNFGVPSEINRAGRAAAGPDILTRAIEFWRSQSDQGVFEAFAIGRGFTSAELKSADMVVGSPEAFLASIRGDGAAEERAVAVGLAFPRTEGDRSPLESPSLAPFARGIQLIIPIANVRGRPEGLMARAIAGGQGPKYRFTTGFRKSSALYGADRVIREIGLKGRGAFFDGSVERFDLFVCEGVFDAIRLRSIGAPAVATLGSSIGETQLELIGEMAKQALEADRLLRVHLFYDADNPGRRAMADVLPRLMANAYREGFLVDVVGLDPRNPGAKDDPDTILRGATDETAGSILSEGLRSPLDALAAIALDTRFADTATAVASLDAAGSIVLQNKLARRFKGLDWPKVWRKLAPHRTTIGVEPIGRDSGLAAIYEGLTTDLRRSGQIDPATDLPDPLHAAERDGDANLLHALILAREATDSREYPVDVAAWDRLEGGAQLFLPLIGVELANRRGPRQPYLAHYEQKDSGAPRMKCGPCPEDAIQQQYVLGELLRIRPGRKDIAARIPAVRYWADRPDPMVTGEGAPRSVVSFAYQIDMRALEERPDRSRRRDMFRPFLDCWNSFIGHVGRRFDRMGQAHGLIYVARLDITGFYDNIPRSAVRAVLTRAIPESESLDAAGIAQLFRPGHSTDRSRDIVEWLLEHSFGDADRGYGYFDPAIGELRHKGGARGLPQGPSLSAYLANIVLFPLDTAMERLVDDLDEAAVLETGRPRACGAVYARYVDDIIIAARSPGDLSNLRNAVESQLDSLGLKLNHKSEHLDPMSPDEARNWAVERRGAGFVAYGDVDDLPSPVHDVRTGWSNIPSIDRRTALNLIYWTALDDPVQTDRSEFENTLDMLARATDLRPTDLGHIARRIALRASLDVAGFPDDGRRSAFLRRYRELWEFVVPRDGEPEHARPPSDHDRDITVALRGARLLLATISGFEKLLLGRPEENPTFPSDVRDRIRAARTDILAWVLNARLLHDLRIEMVAPRLATAVEAGLGSQIDIAIAILEERAARIVRLDRVRFNIAISSRDSGAAPRLRPSTASIRLGWQRTFCPEGLANSEVRDDPLRLFHAIAAEIQAVGSMTVGTRPLDHAMSEAAEEALRLLRSVDGAAEAIEIAMAFRAMAGADDDLPPKTLPSAVSAFLTLCIGPGQVQAFVARPGLAKVVVGNENVHILPLPSISGQPGFFTFDRGSGKIGAVRVGTSDGETALLPDGLQWTRWRAVDDFPVCEVCEANLPDGHAFLLDPISKVRVIDDRLDTIADTVDGILATHGTVGGEHVPLVHVFSLIGPLDAAVRRSRDAKWIVVAWQMPPESCEQLVFERRGYGIAVERSPHAGAQLWRIGQSVADLFAIPAEADETTSLTSERERLIDRLKRLAFSRLRGHRIRDVQVAAALVSREIPKALNRIVRALRETAAANDGLGPHALEFFLTGRAMKARMGLGPWVDTAPGGWARFLEVVGGRIVTPGDDCGLFNRVDIRDGLSRPHRALDRLSRSVLAWEDGSESVRVRTVLSVASLAIALAALRGETRDLVLATVALLSDSDRRRLAAVRPGLGQVTTRGGLVLIEPRYGAGNARLGDFDLDRQSSTLFPELIRALSERPVTGRAIFDRISTLGWLACICVMSGAMDYEMATEEEGGAVAMRPAFPPLREPLVSKPLIRLMAALAALEPPERSDPDAWPWEAAPSMDVGELLRRISEGHEAIAAVAGAFGIGRQSDRPALRMLTRGDSDIEFITADGSSYRLPWWRSSIASLVGERQERTETLVIGDRLVHPHSALTDSEGGILILQLLSEDMATVSGLRMGLPVMPPPLRPEPEPQVQPSPAVTHATTVNTTDDAPLETGEVPLGTSAVVGVSDQSPAIASWRHLQNSCWRARGKDKLPEGVGIEKTGFARIAILQYGFEDSYYFDDANHWPTTQKYSRGGKAISLPKVYDGAVQLHLSFEEYHRRRVLQEVLACCHLFGVEILVLPEYAARPETINWLQRHCHDRDYKISIWAGTFRQPHGFELAQNQSNSLYVPADLGSAPYNIKPMDAVLSVLFRESQTVKDLNVQPVGRVTDEAAINSLQLDNRIHFRRKKYPSIGMFEEIRPSLDSLDALVKRSHSLNRAESFVMELICSELFVFNGPLNWYNFAAHLTENASRYNVITKDDWLDHIITDAKSLARIFGGSQNHKPRRSILLLPCATSRDADYHYFAQGAYLADGIVTAFCNAPAPFANGGSCFVGLGGWETGPHGATLSGPYHGALPGLLTSGGKKGSPLGKDENALVIVDIRPDRTVEDKPRSQTRSTPIKLVAHIPIVEDKVYNGIKTTLDVEWWHERTTRWLDADEQRFDFEKSDGLDLAMNRVKSRPEILLSDFLGKAYAVVDALGNISTLQASNHARSIVTELAVSLAHLFECSPGMRLRASMIFKGMLDHPERMPPPALCDWLFVDLDIERFGRHLDSLARQDSEPMKASDLPTTLREAPWVWSATTETEETPIPKRWSAS